MRVQSELQCPKVMRTLQSRWVKVNVVNLYHRSGLANIKQFISTGTMRWIIVLMCATGTCRFCFAETATTTSDTTGKVSQSDPPQLLLNEVYLKSGELKRIRRSRLSDLKIIKHLEGYRVVVENSEGLVEFSPHRFVEILYEQNETSDASDWLYRLFNIENWTGMAWVSLGLIGQMFFSLRMIVQWIVSERHKQSKIPVVFWWFSIIGGAMLLMYFVWRQDIVGILGQSLGVFIYFRNLMLIYGQSTPNP